MTIRTPHTVTTPSTPVDVETPNTTPVPAPVTVCLNKENIPELPVLSSVDPKTFEQWTEQVKASLVATGETFFEVGTNDNGEQVGLDEARLAVSLATLREVVNAAGAEAHVMRTRTSTNKATKTTGLVAEVLVRRCGNGYAPVEVHVATVGNVDSGKSTLLGVLSSGSLDDGRGSARAAVLHFPHERETGRTSSIGHRQLFYRTDGSIVNKPAGTAAAAPVPATKCVALLDLAGHARYLKTTLFGMTGHHPDYAMLTVGANMGVVGMTKEHLGITLALRVPALFVVTKIDMCPDHILAETLTQLKRLAKAPGCRKLPFMVRTMDDVVVCARNFAGNKLLPIFCVSNVTGASIDLLHAFLNLVPTMHRWGERAAEPLQIDVDCDWSIPGVGTVVSGTIVSGTLDLHTPLVLGPDHAGAFVPISLRNIRTQFDDCDHAVAGQAVTLAVRRLARSAVQRGMVIMRPDTPVAPCMRFEAEVLVLYHSTTIVTGYECVVHCNAVRQSARVVAMDKPILRSGDKAVVTFAFNYHPEILPKNARVIFRDGHAKCIGRVLSTTPFLPSGASASMTPSDAGTSAGFKKRSKKRVKNVAPISKP